LSATAEATHELIWPPMQAFFTDRLIRQRCASPHPIANYRDTMRLLLAFARPAAVAPDGSLDHGPALTAIGVDSRVWSLADGFHATEQLRADGAAEERARADAASRREVLQAGPALPATRGAMAGTRERGRMESLRSPGRSPTGPRDGSRSPQAF
jgi:hypothetical protein